MTRQFYLTDLVRTTSAFSIQSFTSSKTSLLFCALPGPRGYIVEVVLRVLWPYARVDFDLYVTILIALHIIHTFTLAYLRAQLLVLSFSASSQMAFARGEGLVVPLIALLAWYVLYAYAAGQSYASSFEPLFSDVFGRLPSRHRRVSI